MGVPKFFRFISERYPCLSEIVKEYEIPEYDNFYIDANGIIHNCSHPDDSLHARISEEDIFKDIFYYLEMLFRIIKPKKLFFIAIDGVAPRAKMNQQRSRRFRTAKDTEKAIEEAIKKGEKVPEERFDSNCITPGTLFMDKLHKQLQCFIKRKISSDELWQRPKIILSGHNVPGEGEHKIMDYIRYLRSQSDWDPNTRHCLHGLDADLIMLGLCSHEPHFSLLREEVKFGRNAKKKTNAEETKFYLLHLSLMRDYLDLEFQSLKNKLPFPYELERIIDDWVLMGFLVGNDFIPNLPHFHIANNALDLLYKAYMEILPTLDGYINNSGTLNLLRFEKYLRRLAMFDFDNFKDVHANMKYFESKTGKTFPGAPKASELDELDDEVLALAKETDMMLGIENSESDSTDDETLREEFMVHKADFYKNKLEYNKVDSETLREQAEGYIRAIQWNLYYYYSGCPSWSWYYPHHYSPYVSDIKGFSGLDVKFEPSTPFLPFQQLLAVLPAASKTIVPQPFQELMTSPDSPIINFYPSEFETDLNGKKNDWEAVVLLPFIDEKSLLSAMEPYYNDLTEEENMRNSVKPMEIYQYTSESLGRCEAPEYFPPVEDNHAKQILISTSEIALKPNQLVRGLLPGAICGAYLGFPHLSGIPFTAKLSAEKVKVFEHPSRGENMILHVKSSEIKNDDELEAIANELIGQVVFVGWPHIQRGKVTSIITEKYQFRMDSGKVVKHEEKCMRYGIDSIELRRDHKMTLGIDLQKVDVVVYVKTVTDLKNHFAGKTAKLLYEWNKVPKPFPYQTLLRTAAVLDKDEDVGKERDLTEVFIPDLRVFLLTPKNYGAFGKVTKVTEENRVEVDVEIKPSIDVSGILDLSAQTDLKYYPGSVASQRLGLRSHLFSRVTGSIFIQNIENEGKLNIGLGLKFTKQGEEVIGFTRKEGNLWLYSEKTIALIDDYVAKFPELFEYLEQNSGNDIYFNKDVFPENTKEKVKEVKDWLKAQPHATAERRQSGAKLLTNEAIKEIEKRITDAKANKTLRNELVLVDPSKLYIPSTHLGKAPPDLSVKVQLLDRIISTRKNHCIPIGLQGIVIGFDKPSRVEDTLYDILFEEPIIGGRCLACDEPRVYRLPCQAFIDISYGRGESEKIISFPKNRMENHSQNRDDYYKPPGLRNSLRNDNSMMVSSPRNDNANSVNIGNIKVKEFFDGYRNSRKVATPPGHVNRMAFPNNNAMGERRELGADLEFKAFWSVLENQKPPEEGSLCPQIPLKTKPLPQTVVEPAVNVEQTNALRKLLKLTETTSPSGKEKQGGELRPQVPLNQPQINKTRMPNNTNVFSPQVRHHTKSCGHMECCSALVKLCTSKNIPYPLYNYTVLPSGEVTCTVSFFNEYSYGNHVGDVGRTKEEAAESAACKAIRHILEREESMRTLVPAGLGYRLQQSGIRHSSPTLRGGALPPPPMQWCDSRRPMRGHNAGSRRSPRGPTPPNQVQSLQRHVPSTANVEVACMPSPENRLANAQNKNEAERKSSSGKPAKPNQHQPATRRPFGSRSRARPRIAANFSVPITNNQQP